MNALGINHYIARSTLYGDWSCTVINNDTNENIGKFCADSGMVAVFLLDEVLKYNPKFNCHTDAVWTTTLIENFKGTVNFTVVHTEGVYNVDTEYTKAGDKWEDDNVRVIGNGINKLTGEPINFTSYQTGF